MWRSFRQLTLALAALLVAAACSSGESPEHAAPAGGSPASASPTVTAVPATAHAAPAPEPRGDAERGRKLAAEYQCQRCHEGTDLPAIDDERHCTRCHQQVMDGRFDHKQDSKRWRQNVAHLTVVPSLKSLGRLRYQWVVGYLLEPHDLRPNLEPTMPRLKLTRAQARDIATYLRSTTSREAQDETPAGDVQAGRRLFEDKGCNSCHAYSGSGAKGVAIKARESRTAVELAPDLRNARDRLPAATVAAWIRNPLAIKPDTPMPETPMTEQERRDLVAFIMSAKLTPPAPYRVPARLPLLKRRVTFDEVNRRVLGVTCRHCHGDPEVARGDGGPGNSGGFGFAPRRIDVSSYQRIMSGMLGADGEQHSLFEKDERGEPWLVAALWARHDELAGKPREGIRGMPLGLPPLPAEDIQLVESWIAQGRPR